MCVQDTVDVFTAPCLLEHVELFRCYCVLSWGNYTWLFWERSSYKMNFCQSDRHFVVPINLVYQKLANTSSFFFYSTSAFLTVWGLYETWVDIQIARNQIVLGWRGVVLEKLTVSLLVRKLPAFYGTSLFNGVIRTFCHYCLSHTNRDYNTCCLYN
jgi:hypothetical protein